MSRHGSTPAKPRRGSDGALLAVPGCRGGAPAVEAHGCAALASAAGAAPAKLPATRPATHVDPLLACPDGQVLPQAQEADHTQTQQGEGMNAVPTHPEVRIMNIMSNPGWPRLSRLSVLPKLCRLLLNPDVTRNHVVV
jgi:hypothetical protein